MWAHSALAAKWLPRDADVHARLARELAAQRRRQDDLAERQRLTRLEYEVRVKGRLGGTIP